MSEVKFYDGKLPITFTVGEMVDLIQAVDSDFETINSIKDDLNSMKVHLPADTVNRIKNLIFERGLHKTNGLARNLLACSCPLPNPKEWENPPSE